MWDQACDAPPESNACSSSGWPMPRADPWELPAGGFWIGLPLAIAAIVIAGAMMAMMAMMAIWTAVG
jgi:hypothetical protein